MAVYNLERFHILLVEDNPYIRRTLAGLLKQLGVGQVTARGSGTEAIEELQKIKAVSGASAGLGVDIILSDLLMSPMNGLLLLRWVRTAKDSPNRFMPFIMISGAADVEYVRAARDMGVTEFLGKPFSVDSVSKRLLGVIDSPRQTVMTRTYFGPERRRRSREVPAAEERRTTGEEDVTIAYSADKITKPKSGSQVWYFRLSNGLKDKAGGLGASGPGEFSLDLLAKAEEEMERSALEFTDWALGYLKQLSRHCDDALAKPGDRHKQFEEINLLAHELRGQGGTFGYPLVTTFAKMLYEFTGPDGRQDDSAVEIVKAHVDALRVVIRDKVSGDGGTVGQELLASLNAAIVKNSESVDA